MYRTIVADPPWPYATFARNVGGRYANGTGTWTKRGLPYPALAVNAIRALPVADLAAADARLFLWTTNRYLPDAFGVIDAWGFEYRQTIVWHKTGNPNPWIGHVAPNHAEFLLVAVRGAPERLDALRSNVWPIDANPAKLAHSQKPEAFLDLVEQVSPAPRLELFARRNRFGWDTWGDQAIPHVDLAGGAG